MNRVGFLSRVVGVGGGVYRELLVVAESVDGALGDEPCMVDRAVVDHLHESFVFVRDGGVIDIDQSVRATGKQDITARWVILKLKNDHR